MAGLMIVGLLALISPSAGATSTWRAVDLRSPLSQDIQGVLTEWCPDYRMNDWDIITTDVQLSAEDYNLTPGLILSLMAGEQTIGRISQARLYYFNLDMGSNLGNQEPPVAWFDSERVARAYCSQFERYEIRDASIAAYFVGHSQLPPDGSIRTQPQSFIDLVSMVMRLDAEWTHLGGVDGPQIVDANEITMDSGPLIIEIDENTPASAFDIPTYDSSEVEAAYIHNMIHFNSGLDEEMGHEIFTAIATYAEQHQTVDARLVMALVACESSFRPDAVSRVGAQGLGQLMPFTAERFGVNDPFDIDENIRATFQYLEREIERWQDHNYPLDRILSAYNAGPGAVEQYTDAPHYGIPPYAETVDYVQKVVNIYFYLLPEGERVRFLRGQSRHVIETNNSVSMAS